MAATNQLSYFELFKLKFSELTTNSNISGYITEKIIQNKQLVSNGLSAFTVGYKDMRTSMHQRIQKILDSTDLDEKLFALAAESKLVVLRMGPDIKMLITSLDKISASDPELAKVLAPSLKQLHTLYDVINGLLSALNLGSQLANNTADVDAALQNSDYTTVVSESKQVTQDVVNGLKLLSSAGMLPKTLTNDHIEQMNTEINNALNEAAKIAPELVKQETKIEVTRPVTTEQANIKPKI